MTNEITITIDEYRELVENNLQLSMLKATLYKTAKWGAGFLMFDSDLSDAVRYICPDIDFEGKKTCEN